MLIPPDRWECLPLIDFGIKLLNKIPSKRLNLEYLPSIEIENLRITYEEWNLAISPLQIVRGLAALHILADGKCKTKLAVFISKALFGAKGLSEKDIHEVLNYLCLNYLKPLSRGAIQIYFEENHLLKFDNELVEYIEKYYGTESQEQEIVDFDVEERTKKEVLQTMCFQMNPNGQTTVNEMNKNIKESTQGIMEHVVRNDLQPRQMTRLALATSFNSIFYWKPPNQINEVTIFFYENCEKMTCTRSVTKGYQCDGLFRTCLTDDGTRVLELASEIDNLKMYLFQPRMPFSTGFLKLLNAEKVQSYINQINLNPTKQSVIIPRFSIISPIGLRSVLASCNPFYHFIFKNKHPLFPYPCIARIFSPDKAEFGKIYGKKSSQENYGSSHVYPLWDYYHKTKMALKTGQPKLTKGIEDEQKIVTCTEKTLKDEAMDKHSQQLVTVAGKLMIIEGEVGIDRKHYMIGILENTNDEHANGKQIFNSFTHKATQGSKKGNQKKSRSSSQVKRNDAVNKMKQDVINKRASESAKTARELTENARQVRTHRNISRKNDTSQHKSKTNEKRKSRTESSVRKSIARTYQQISKKEDETQKHNNNLNIDRTDNDNESESDKTQFSPRFTAGADIENKDSTINYGKSSHKKVNEKWIETTFQKQSILRLLKEPEVPIANKLDTVMVEHDEELCTDTYFAVKENQARDIQANIVFNTPFLYMILSKSEIGRYLIVSMGRFTNIRETNPLENMYS